MTFCILREKNDAELQTRKPCIFDGLWAMSWQNTRVLWECRIMQNLQDHAKISSRPAPPAGVRRILNATPIPPGWLSKISKYMQVIK